MTVCLRAAPSAWELVYRVQGPADDMQRLLLPKTCKTTPAAFAHGLWQHTCFEWFVKPAGGSAYREFNFSPSGQWATYAFERERVPAAAADAVAPQVRLHTDRPGLQLTATVPKHALPGLRAPFQLGLSAVIETRDGALSYWALQHPSAQPDFHHTGSFVPFSPALPT